MQGPSHFAGSVGSPVQASRAVPWPAVVPWPARSVRTIASPGVGSRFSPDTLRITPQTWKNLKTVSRVSQFPSWLHFASILSTFGYHFGGFSGMGGISENDGFAMVKHYFLRFWAISIQPFLAVFFMHAL